MHEKDKEGPSNGLLQNSPINEYSIPEDMLNKVPEWITKYYETCNIMKSIKNDSNK